VAEIVVAAYDPRWPSDFDEIVAVVWPAVREEADRMEHVGSTAVPGLAAKPIIDVDVVVPDADRVAPVRARLGGIGYAWLGELGVEGRDAFEAATELALPAHHLYLVVDGSRPYLDHVLLRDLLRRDPGARARYEQLKRHNAQRAGGDVEVYTARKAAFVAELLATARRAGGLPAVEYWIPTEEELGRHSVDPDAPSEATDAT
jgi:GrpB-like predicted nucleotidyltransferase (UPF0157 family)